MAKYTIVMVRHGESEWNQKNLFCGWYDANLSTKGNNNINLILLSLGLGQCMFLAGLHITWIINGLIT